MQAIYWQAADGSDSPRQLVRPTEGRVLPSDFADDGATLLYTMDDGDADVWAAPVRDEPADGTPLLAGPAGETNATVSPGGRWLAYQSDESGRWEVYVRPYPDVDGGGIWQISTEGGTHPHWSPDGRELFYLDLAADASQGRGALMAVPIEADASLRPGTPEPLFSDGFIAISPNRLVYDVAPDGERFLMTDVGGSDAGPPRVVVVDNWTDELRRLVPPAR